jgi:hypothetical protein
MDYKAKQAARAVAAAAMQAANPFLIPLNDGDRLTTAAKNLRIQLKRAFPGVKFRVTTSRFSMGNSMRVSWTDGPNADQVGAYANLYSAGSFDGMTDSYNYEDDAFTDAFGEAKYVQIERANSDQAIANVMHTMMAKYAANFKALGIDSMNAEDMRAGKYNAVDLFGSGQIYGGNSLPCLIRQMAAKRTYALDQSPKALPMIEIEGAAA